MQDVFRVGEARRLGHVCGVPLLALVLGACQPTATTSPGDDPAGPSSPGYDPASWVPPPGVGASTSAGSGGQSETPTLTWKQRMAIDVDSFKRDDALRYMRVRTAIPDEEDPDDPAFAQLLSGDPRSAGVILQRLISGAEPLEVRIALAEQLPYTRGDWHEGAAVLIRLDPDPEVRKVLVEKMRYAEAPHAAIGLRSGLEDESPSVRAAAARTAGFQPSAALIEAELTASLLGDSDWETRAAIAHSLGSLGLVSAFPALTEALGDRDRRVRLASLQTMARLDLQQTAGLEEVKALSRGGDQATKAAARRILKQAKAAEAAGVDPSPAAGAAPAE